MFVFSFEPQLQFRQLWFHVRDFVQAFDQQKHRPRHNEELNAHVQEGANFNGHFRRRGDVGRGIRHDGFLEHHLKARQVDAANEHAHDRVDQILHDGVHDFSKRRANDNADGQVHGIALDRERFEFFDNFHVSSFMN